MLSFLLVTETNLGRMWEGCPGIKVIEPPWRLTTTLGHATMCSHLKGHLDGNQDQ